MLHDIPYPDGHGDRTPTAATPHFEVVLQGQGVEILEGADAYQQEGPMTTFFRCGPDRDVIDSWSTRIASFRTNDIVAIRRLEALPQHGFGGGSGSVPHALAS